MKRSKEELLQSLKGFIGEDESENAIAFLEDFSDSFADNSDELVEVTNKYNSLKKRYKERFLVKVMKVKSLRKMRMKTKKRKLK